MLKPQHRIVLGLVAMSAAALLITLLNPAPPEGEGAPSGPGAVSTGPAARPVTPGTTPGARAVVPIPVVPSVGTATPEALGARVQRLGVDLAPCTAAPTGFAPADGRLDLVVALGPAGPEGAYVDGLAALGPEAEACVSGALGAAPWPQADPPQAVRIPFYVVQPVGRTDDPPPTP